MSAAARPWAGATESDAGGDAPARDKSKVTRR